MSAESHVLSGWGESHHGWARVVRPRSADEAARELKRAADDGRRLCLRGADRSYGDASVLSRGDVLDMTAFDRVLEFDETAGTIVVEPGVTIETLWRTALPRGFWPAVVPGTMRPTVGGCIAMNIHGKNHFQVGGFGAHVTELDVAFPDGSRRTLRRQDNLFHAVVGGAGLLGVVTRATLHLKPVRSGLLNVTAIALPSFPELVAEMEARAAAADYLVGWIDCFDGKGRAVLHDARHLGVGEDDSPATTLAVESQELPGRIAGVVPRGLAPAGLKPFANPRGMAFINAAKYRATRVRGVHRFRQPHVQFAFLLDYIPGWKRIYDPGGLIQHQSFVPKEHAVRVHSRLMELCRERGIVSWLGVYKRHRACPFLMTHAVDGWSFAMDFPVTSENRGRLWALCREMDEVVLAAGGRFYFAKDLTATPAALVRAYPGLERFREIKREVDPTGVLTSDLAARLNV